MTEPLTTPAGRVLPAADPIHHYDAWQDNEYRILRNRTTGEASVYLLTANVALAHRFSCVELALAGIDAIEGDQPANPFDLEDDPDVR